MTYSSIQGGWPGEGNIDVDPLLTPDGHLEAESPCIDAGDNTAVPLDVHDLDCDGNMVEPFPVDIDGDARLIDTPDAQDTGNGTPPLVDMGADEFQDEDTDDLPDWWELLHYGDTIAANPWSDDDGDLVCNRDEYLVYGSNPLGSTWYVSAADGPRRLGWFIADLAGWLGRSNADDSGGA